MKSQASTASSKRRAQTVPSARSVSSVWHDHKWGKGRNAERRRFLLRGRRPANAGPAFLPGVETPSADGSFCEERHLERVLAERSRRNAERRRFLLRDRARPRDPDAGDGRNAERRRFLLRVGTYRSRGRSGGVETPSADGSFCEHLMYRAT